MTTFFELLRFRYDAIIHHEHQTLTVLHCTENPIYVFPEMKRRGLVPNSSIQVAVSDLYIPRIGLPIWLQQNRQTVEPGEFLW
jgi:hypothetical protein